MEAARPSAIIDIIHSGEAFEVREEIKKTQKAQRECFVESLGQAPYYAFKVSFLCCT